MVDKKVLDASFGKVSIAVLENVDRVVTEQVDVVVEDESTQTAPLDECLLGAGTDLIENDKSVTRTDEQGVLVGAELNLALLEGILLHEPVLVPSKHVAIVVET